MEQKHVEELEQYYRLTFSNLSSEAYYIQYHFGQLFLFPLPPPILKKRNFMWLIQE